MTGSTHHGNRRVGARALPAAGVVALLIVAVGGCQGLLASSRLSNNIQQVALAFDTVPWLNFDPTTHPKPEGVKFSVFLIDGKTQRGAFGDGDIVVQMYIREPKADGTADRVLAKEWRYGPDEALRGREEKPVGWGYGMRLDWRPADVVGQDIEIGVLFERRDGNVIRSRFKRLTVPMPKQLQSTRRIEDQR